MPRVERPLSEKARERWLWRNPDPQVWEAFGQFYMQVTFPVGHKLEGVWRACGSSYEQALDRFIQGAQISRVPQEMLT